MNRHSFDPISFVLGLMVTAAGVLLLAGVTSVHWLVPLILGAIGTAFVVGALRKSS